MRRDEVIVAGTAIPCGARLLVPLVRVRVHAPAAWAGMAEADVVAFVCCPHGAAPSLLALDDTLPPQGDWSAWLAAQPGLLADIRARLEAAHAAAPRHP